MIQSCFIPHRLPNFNDMVKAAKQRRGAWSGYALMKADWQRTISVHLRKAKLKPMPAAHVRFVWHEANKRRDLDGITAGSKFVLDSLVALRIIPTDGWAGVLSLTHEFCLNKRPGVQVEISLTASGGEG